MLALMRSEKSRHNTISTMNPTNMETMDDGTPSWRCMVFAPTCTIAYNNETMRMPIRLLPAKLRGQLSDCEKNIQKMILLRLLNYKLFLRWLRSSSKTKSCKIFSIIPLCAVTALRPADLPPNFRGALEALLCCYGLNVQCNNLSDLLPDRYVPNSKRSYAYKYHRLLRLRYNSSLLSG